MDTNLARSGKKTKIKAKGHTAEGNGEFWGHGKDTVTWQRPCCNVSNHWAHTKAKEYELQARAGQRDSNSQFFSVGLAVP